MTAVLDWREAMRPKDRAGKRTENGLQAHLRLEHGYTVLALSALSTVQLVFRHEREHPFERGHGR